MPLIVLLDASSPQTSEQLPLSWWCAAELAQWPSAAMATDVFQLTLTRHLRRMSREEKLNSSNSEVVQSASYVIRDSIKHSSINSNSKRVYLFLPFPQTIKVANKYFTTEIHLLCGFYVEEQEVHDHHNTTSNEQNISQQEELKLNCILLNDNNNNNNNNSNDIIHNQINELEEDDDVSVFMSKWDEIVSEYTLCNGSQRRKENELLNVERLQDINYNNAGVIYLTSSAPHLKLPSAIWEMFTHSTSAIKAVMFFSRETEKHNSNCKEKGNVSRWRDVCVDEEIELIVHGREEISNSKFEQEEWHERDGRQCENVIDDSCSGHNNIMWEKVDANVGKLGILSPPVTGTNRLMQLLAQTPWPEQVEECEEQECSNSNTIHSMESQSAKKKRTHSTSVATPLTDSSEPQNVFLVVTDCATATIDAFVQEEHALTNLTNKWIERFYTVKGKSAHCSQRHKYNICSNDDSNAKQELVLVNRYYAASIRAHHMHFYWFHPSMSQMCQEQLISLIQTDGFALHAYVFATSEMYKSLVSSPSTSSTVCTEKHWQPSLHKIVSELQLYNINVIIVVIRDDNVSSIGVNSKEYSDVENYIVLKEKAEVIWLNSLNVNNTRFEEYEQHELEHETHGCDRLRETLHCVDWKYKLHRVPLHAMPHVLYCSKEQMPQHNNNTEHVQNSVGMNKENNTCLLSVFGENAEKEEEILYKLLSECFNFDFDFCSALSPCVQRNKYKSIVSVVPSLLFERVDEHGVYVNMGPCLYNISNKYMTATVKIDALGGICTRQDVYCENALELHVSEYDALLVCCTFEALSRAAAIGVAATANTLANNWDNTKNVDTMSMLLCHAIQSLQSIAEKEFDSLANNINGNKSNDCNSKEIDLEHVEEHVISEEESIASPLMALFVIDVPAEDTIMTEKILKLINAVICSGNTNNSNSAKSTMNEQYEYKMSTCQSDEKMCEESMESNILFEVIFAECKENQTEQLENELHVSSTEEEEDTFTTYGISRVREMMEQHCWRVREEIKQSAYSSENDSTHDVKAKVMEHQESLESNAHIHQIGEEDVIKDNDVESSTEEERNTFQRATCALPPHYLIDPETLRSTPVRVLRYVQQCQRCQASTLKNDKITNEKYKEWNKGTLEYAHELQMWMTKMNKYGHKLTKTQRQEQAAVLASAL